MLIMILMMVIIILMMFLMMIMLLLLTRLLIWARRLCRPAARWWPWPSTISFQVELKSYNYDVNHKYDNNDNCYDDDHDRRQHPFRLDFESCFLTIPIMLAMHDNILSDWLKIQLNFERENVRDVQGNKSAEDHNQIELMKSCSKSLFFCNLDISCFHT